MATETQRSQSMTKRNHFTAAAFFLCALCASVAQCAESTDPQSTKGMIDLKSLDRDREVKAADAMLNDGPITVTASHSSRSAGGEHDFFSEGDYWWPDPAHPDGPYIQKDGMTNPDNFVEHRHAMIRMSIHVATL